MRKKGLIYLLLLVPLVFGAAQTWGQELSYKGELSGMFSTVENQAQNDWLVRYLPEIIVKSEGDKTWTWDASLAAYLYAYDSPAHEAARNAEIFRAWLRIYDETTEYRLGLQELSFGPAQLLRSLQWFDSKNPLDPTSFTKGVKGALARVSTDDNSAYWLWGLYGNEDLYALTLFVSDMKQPEFGGRAQFSEDMAEWGLSFHQRHAILTPGTSVNENRLGLDLKLDMEYNGLWLESMMINRDAGLPYSARERLATLGIDYSLDFIAEGVTLVLEHHRAESRTAATNYESSAINNALMVSVGQELLDSYSITFMNSKLPKTSLIRFDWKRTYDDFLWDLSLFQSKPVSTPAQFGLGLIVQYNH
ncbi:MAG: hypothetical protein OEY59_07125 [Deltaproteobacteria bacterium]|nr:hypothetical protein [Deltaproteobacteria bacterium]